MNYINPIEILELKDMDVSAIDSSVIKKAKRRLIANIELSDDGFLDYRGEKLTKSDCEGAIDLLEDNDNKEYLIHLASNEHLNAFLANGNQEILNSFNAESIYKLPEFVAFVSPYVSARLNRILLKSFQSSDSELLSKALRLTTLVTKSDHNKVYQGIDNEIKQRITEIDELTTQLTEKRSKYTEENSSEVQKRVEDLFPLKILNNLPVYFQGQLNNIASSVNFMLLEFWGAFENPTVPSNILDYILQFNIESVHKPTYEKNYDLFKKKSDDRVEQEKNKDLLEIWTSVLTKIKQKNEALENKRIKGKAAYGFVKNALSVKELNNLPPYADELRVQIATTIRDLSIGSWNEYNDLRSALSFIKLALSINLPDEVKSLFENDKNDLDALAKKYKGILECYFCQKEPPEESSEIETTIYQETSRGFRSVEYKYSAISIPRCSECKSTHGKASITMWTIIVVGLLLGLLIGAGIDVVFYIGGGVGLGLGIIIGLITKSTMFDKAGIKSDSNSSVEGHPLLKDRIREGWTLSKPTA